MTHLLVLNQECVEPSLLVVPIGVERTEIRLALCGGNGKLFYFVKVLPPVFWMEDPEDVACGVCWIIAFVEVEVFEDARASMFKDCHVVFLGFGNIMWFEIPSWRKERSWVIKTEACIRVFNSDYILVGSFV